MPSHLEQGEMPARWSLEMSFPGQVRDTPHLGARPGSNEHCSPPSSNFLFAGRKEKEMALASVFSPAPLGMLRPTPKSGMRSGGIRVRGVSNAFGLQGPTFTWKPSWLNPPRIASSGSWQPWEMEGRCCARVASLPAPGPQPWHYLWPEVLSPPTPDSFLHQGMVKESEVRRGNGTVLRRRHGVRFGGKGWRVRSPEF